MILCPSCNGALPAWSIRTNGAESLCPTCYSGLTIEVFPALFRRRTTIERSALTLAEGDACCYEHATKRAIEVCHACGRFLCALCEVEIQGKVWCPGCLPIGQAQAKGHPLETQRTLYDSMALALATWPMLLFLYPSMLTSPVVLYLVIRHWKSPSSLIPRNRWRFVLALMIALCELCLLALLILAVVIATRRKLS